MSTRQMSPQHQEKGETPANNNPAQQKRTPWYKQLNWLMVTMVLLVPAFAGLSTIWIPFQRKTQIMAFFYSLTKGFSITAGTHPFPTAILHPELYPGIHLTARC